MSWRIYVTSKAEKQIKRLPTQESERVERTIDSMESNPFAGDIEKIKGEERIWRRRIGAYRIIYEVSVQQKLIRIYEIKRKTSNTY